MKKRSPALVANIVFGLVAGIPTARAQTDSITVSSDDISFVIDHYNDGRTSPNKVTMTGFGSTSVYAFAKDGFIAEIKAEDELYNVVYNNDGKLNKVKRISPGRKLADADGAIENSPFAVRRRLYGCEDCEQTWETVCGKGVETVCNLEGYGEPFLSAGVASIGVFCDTLGSICSQRTASIVCDGGCKTVRCLSPLTITLEWTGGSGLSAREEPSLDLYVIEPGGQTAQPWNSNPGFGVITSTRFEKRRTYNMLSGLADPDSTKGRYIAFGEWWEGFAPIAWTMTAVDGTGNVLQTSEGMFTGDCGATMTSSSTISNSDQGMSRGTTNLMYVDFSQFVDNGCEA